MNDNFINLNQENIDKEHICCAIADKKHQCGVDIKKEWLKERIQEGHIFRKLNQKGKVFIEYALLDSAWVPVEGDNYIYIYCLWVSGSFKGKGYGKELLEYCINHAKKMGKSGVCEQIKSYCNANKIDIDLIPIDSLEKAKMMPCVFNNWAVFNKGKFETVHLLNEGYLKKMLEIKEG